MDLSAIIDQLAQTAVESLDFLLIAGAVIVVEVLKRVTRALKVKPPADVWLGVTLALGLVLAWIQVPVVIGHGKEYAGACFKYGGGAVLTYEVWRRFGPRLTRAWAALRGRP